MTVVAGVAHEGRVYMGADSAGTGDSGDIVTRHDPKVFTVGAGRMLIGFTGSFRQGQLLRFSLKVPSVPRGMDIYEWAVRKLVDQVRRCLQVGGAATNEKGTEEGSQFLVGFRGHLFQVYSDYQVEESAFEYNACGAGYGYAMGSFFASTAHRKKPLRRLHQALDAACTFSAICQPPLTVLELPPYKPR